MPSNVKKHARAAKLKKLRHRLRTAKGMLTITVPSDMSDDAYDVIKSVMPNAITETRIHSVQLRDGSFQDRVRITVIP